MRDRHGGTEGSENGGRWQVEREARGMKGRGNDVGGNERARVDWGRSKATEA